MQIVEQQAERHTLRTKSCCFQAAVQRKDVESKGTRLATATLDVAHESVDEDEDSWWLSATQNPSRESSSRRTEEAAIATVRQSVSCC